MIDWRGTADRRNLLPDSVAQYAKRSGALVNGRRVPAMPLAGAVKDTPGMRTGGMYDTTVWT